MSLQPTEVEEEGSALRPLNEMAVGTNCEVQSVQTGDRGRLARLAAYGVVPGSQVYLVQKRPAVVIRVGETDLALDWEVAQDILVRPVC